MTAEEHQPYADACAMAKAMMNEGEFEFVRIGHVGSPPGNQYHVGQFVVVMKRPDEPITAIFQVNGATMLLDQFKPTRSRGLYRKKGSALYAMIHDPSGLIGQSRREAA